MSERFPEVLVNLTEQPDWEEWDCAGLLTEKAGDAAHQSFYRLPISEVRKLVEDLAGPVARTPEGPKEWSPRGVNPNRFLEIAQQVRNGRDDALDATRFAIIDAFIHMYENAMAPNTGDIRDAMNRTADRLYTGYHLDRDLWEPVLETRTGEWWSEGAILRTLLNRVDFARNPDDYNRILVFDFGKAVAVIKILKWSPWPKKQLDSRLKTEFRRLREQYMEDFFIFLKSEFSHVDIRERAQWSVPWKQLMQSPDYVRDAREELRKALRGRFEGGTR